MNIVGRQLEADGYEFMGVNSQPKKNPQFVCLKEKQLYFIIVRYVAYPNDPKKYDWTLLETMKAHAEVQNAIVYYAGVGLYNSSDRFLPVILNEEYLVDYDGPIEIIDE